MKILDWLSPANFSSRQEGLRNMRVDNSGKWFLDTEQFKSWFEGNGANCLLCAGGRMPSIRPLLIVQSERESRFSCKFLTISVLTYRSIAVDYINDQTAKVIYIYFDYKSQQNQTCIDIARSLLRQLLSQLTTIPNNITDYFEECISQSRTPDIDIIVENLMSLSSVSLVYAIFDAMDECRENNLSKVLEVFNKLQKSFRLLISTRHHLVQNLRDNISNIELIDIKADMNDMENYVRKRLCMTKNAKPSLEERCVDLVKGVHGMYSPLS
jgi:hypothetical protein